jgi:hypothetical protein
VSGSAKNARARISVKTVVVWFSTAAVPAGA